MKYGQYCFIILIENMDEHRISSEFGATREIQVFLDKFRYSFKNMDEYRISSENGLMTEIIFFYKFFME